MFFFHMLHKRISIYIQPDALQNNIQYDSHQSHVVSQNDSWDIASAWMFGHIHYNCTLFLLCNFSYVCLTERLSSICSCKKCIETSSDLYACQNVVGSDSDCQSLYHRHHTHISIEPLPAYVQVSHDFWVPF